MSQETIGIEQYESLKRELEGMKNLIEDLNRRSSKSSTLAANCFDEISLVRKESDTSAKKVTKLSKVLGEIKDSVEKDNGTTTDSSPVYDEDELKKVIIESTPYENISVFVKKTIKQELKSVGKEKKPEKDSKKSNIMKYIIGIALIVSLSYVGYNHFNKNKLKIGVMPKGTQYHDVTRDRKGTLRRDKKVSGYIRETNTKDGFKRVLVSKEIKNGKEYTYKYSLK